jgi:hypothetical protein
MASRKLSEIAKTIRSKNAGVDKITFDVIFPDRGTYARVRESGVLSREAVCRIFGIAAAQISDHVEFDPALAIKFTIYRRAPSGSPGDADIFGSQQYGPLLDIQCEILTGKIPSQDGVCEVLVILPAPKFFPPTAAATAATAEGIGRPAPQQSGHGEAQLEFVQ